jgi:hypothetical protein
VSQDSASPAHSCGLSWSNAFSLHLFIKQEALCRYTVSVIVDAGWLFGLYPVLSLTKCVLPAAVLTVFGSFLLYSKIEDNGCDPGGAVNDNATCRISGADVFGAMLGTTNPHHPV